MKNKNTFLYTPEEVNAAISFEDFELAVKTAKKAFRGKRKILMQFRDLFTFYASIAAAQEAKISLYLCPPAFDDRKMQALAKKLQGVVYRGGEEYEHDFDGRGEESSIPYLGIFTSATSGEPKLALLRWDAIQYSSRFVPEDLRGQTWLLSYSPWSYAGLQVFFSARIGGGSIYRRTHSFPKICSDIVDVGVTIISATPTFWKMLISAWPRDSAPPSLLQATVGGEIVDQSVIDMIDAFFKPRRLTHIYASTEAGTAIVVSDRSAGFPVSWLQKQKRSGMKFKIVDNELYIHSSVGMDKYSDDKDSEDEEEWIHTGDLVEERMGRVYFLGRKDARINIGGRKVCPEEVESALNSLEEIEDSLVYEKKSPIVGSLIAADVIIKNAGRFEAVEIKKRLKTILEEYKIPQVIRRVEHFATSNNGKKIRRPA